MKKPGFNFKNRKMDLEKGSPFYTFRNPIQTLDPIENHPHLMPDLMERLNALEEYNHQLYLLKRDLKLNARLVYCYSEWTDVNNYVGHSCLAWQSFFIVMTTEQNAGGVMTYYPLSNEGQGVGFFDWFADEYGPWDFTTDEIPAATMVGLHQVIGAYFPGYQLVFNRHTSDFMYMLNSDELFTTCLNLENLVKPVKQDFSAVITEENRSEAFWPIGGFDTQFIFNVGHYIPNFLMIDRYFTQRLVDRFGPGMLVCRISDDAIPRRTGQILKVTVNHHIIIIPDELAFERVEYLPMSMDRLEGTKYFQQIVDLVTNFKHSMDRIWYYDVPRMGFVQINRQFGKKEIEDKIGREVEPDIITLASKGYNQIPKAIYNIDIVTLALFTFVTMERFNALYNKFKLPEIVDTPVIRKESQFFMDA